MNFIGQVSKEKQLTIERSGFWPGLNVDEFRKKMRILDSVKNEQAEMALLSALDLVMRELRAFRANHSEYVELEDVPSDFIAGRSRYLFNFERAVFNEAKALLLEDFRDMDLTRKAGEDRAALNDPEIDELRRNRWSAIRTFSDQPDGYVALI